MSSSPRNFSLVPTLLLSLALGVILGVIFLLLFNPAVKRNAAAQNGQVMAQTSQNTSSQTSQTQTTQSTQGNQSADQMAQNQSGQNQSGQNQSGQNQTAQTNAAGGLGTTGQEAQGQNGQNANGQTAAPEDPAHGTTQAADPVKGRTYDFFTGQTGSELYVEVCQSCHMPGGKGANGGGGVYNYPALAGNAKLASAPYVESMVLNGNGGMPGFAHYLSDEQAAKIVNYVRTELNKNQDQVKPADLKQIRPPVDKEMTFGEDAG